MDEQAASPTSDAVEVTRSEERLHAGTRPVVVGTVRIAKRVVTEQRTVTVTVRREELVVDQLSTDPDREGDLVSTGWSRDAAGAQEAAGSAGSPAARGRAVVDLVLCEEEVEVSTRVVPRERVRLFVDSVVEEVPVSGTVAREVIDVEGQHTEVDHTEGQHSEGPRTVG